MKDDLTADDLRRRLSYDPASGQLRWLDGARAGKVAGCICSSSGYVHVKLNRYQYLAHRLAWLHYYGEWPRGECDHRDRDRANNSIANLRACSRSQNRANTGVKSTNTSGFKGVSFNKRAGKFRADIRVGSQRKTLGYFSNPVEAARHYQAAALIAHGEFAVVGED